MNFCIADKPFMQPRKDYDDYTKFINDTYTEEKINMLNKTVSIDCNRGATVKVNPPSANLRTYHEFPEKPSSDRFGDEKRHFRSLSLKPQTETEKKMGSTFTDFNVKPKILESKISQRDDFFNLSDGFKKIFSKDTKDVKMIIPIAGYGGHRRGDRSQNFFGKSFRESSL